MPAGRLKNSVKNDLVDGGVPRVLLILLAALTILVGVVPEVLANVFAGV